MYTVRFCLVSVQIFNKNIVMINPDMKEHWKSPNRGILKAWGHRTNIHIGALTS